MHEAGMVQADDTSKVVGVERIVIHNHDVMLTWLPPLLDVIDGAQTPQAACQAGRESESD